MDKKLRDYAKYIKNAAKHPNAELVEYHKAMTQQFQHERLIHLIVTMFFALFMIIFFILFLLLALFLPSSDAAVVIVSSAGAITLILLITTLFYIRHYYLLENGTQELEDITKAIYKRN